MFKKKLKLSSFKEDVDVRVTNTKNDGPSYYPETKRGREFFDAHAKASPVIDKTGAPEHQFRPNLKKIDDHGPPKVDSFAGDPHSNNAIKAQRMEMMPRVKVHKEETELTEEEFNQLDENIRKKHHDMHIARMKNAINELNDHIAKHAKFSDSDNHYHDTWTTREMANSLEDVSLRLGQHVEGMESRANEKAKDARKNHWESEAPASGKVISEEKKYVSSAKTIRELLGKK